MCVMCSDSIALQKMTEKSNQTLQCHNTLGSLAKKRVVELLWISGHNIKADEIADDLAKE